MKKLCRNCGAKVPKKSDICPKCGEPYEYIDIVKLDPETAQMLQVEKPSVMSNVCVIILSVLILAYSGFLFWQKYNEHSDAKKENDPHSDTTVSDEETPGEETAEEEAEGVQYSAVDFVGQPFSEVKKLLGDKVNIKISADTTLIEYTDYPLTFVTADNSFSDESPVTKVIITGNGKITPAASADMTFDALRLVLGLVQTTPELNEKDAYYYIHHSFYNDLCQMSADFRFDDESTDKAPIEVVLTDISLNVPKVMGTVTGLDDYLNIRSAPVYSSEAVHQLMNGDQVEIIGEVTSEDGAEWYEIIFEDSIKGFASADYIVKNSEITNTPAETEAAEESEEETSDSEEEEEETSDDYSDEYWDDEY